MSARAKNRTNLMRMWKQFGVALTAAAVLTGCAQASSVAPLPGVTLAPPMPAGMEEMRPEPPQVPPEAETDCDATASLRPFTTAAEADDAVAEIRARGRLIVGLDIGSNLFSFRDPITGDITGFDVDIAGEIARDIFGSPSQVEYRILSSADRIAALQNNQVDVVVKTMTITCERKKLVNFSTVYLNANQRILAPRDSTIRQPSDLSGKRVCVAKGTTSLQRIQQIYPAADHRRGGDVGRLPGGAAAAPGRRGQHRRLHPGRAGGRKIRICTSSGPASTRSPTASASTCRTPAWCASSTARWSASARRHLEHAVPQVVNRARPRPGAASREVFRLMAEAERHRRGPRNTTGDLRRHGHGLHRPPCGRWPRRRCSARTSTTTRTASRSAPAKPSRRTTRRR